MRKSMHTVAAMAAFAAAAIALESFAAAADECILKAGSYNIRCPADKGANAWKKRRGDLVELVRKLDFDVFGMQEVKPEQAAYITNSLPEYALVGDGRNRDRKSGEESPVCYRKSRFEALKSGTFWLSETPGTPGSKS